MEIISLNFKNRKQLNKKVLVSEFIKKQILCNSIPAVIVVEEKNVYEILVINRIKNPLEWEYGRICRNQIQEGDEEQALFYHIKHPTLFICNGEYIGTWNPFHHIQLRKKTDKQKSGKAISKNNSIPRAGSRLEYLGNNNFDSSKFNIQISYKQHDHRN